MTKANYMALADLQTVWNNKMKPHIQQTYAAASHNHTKSQITDFAHTHDDRYYTKEEVETTVQLESTRAMAKEAQLQGQIIRPVNMDALTPSSTFTANQGVAINGVFYRALRNTSNFPVTMVIQNGQFVYNQSASGHKAYVIADGTLHSDWEVWSDSSIDFWREYFDTRLDTKLDLDTQVGDYSVQQLLEYVASQMANQ